MKDNIGINETSASAGGEMQFPPSSFELVKPKAKVTKPCYSESNVPIPKLSEGSIFACQTRVSDTPNCLGKKPGHTPKSPRVIVMQR